MTVLTSSPRRHVAVVIHDVAASRWAGCARVLAQAQATARRVGVQLPVTLLVVPEMHGEPATPNFIRWLRRQAQAGHELALHGWRHLDEGPPPRGIVDRLRRQFYTAGEGEFAALARDVAAARLHAGLDWADRHGLPIAGFVAPAWLMSREAWDAVGDGPFGYTCTLSRVVALPGHQALHARSLVFSTRSAWRVHASVLWNGMLGLVQRRSLLQRFELHPSDCDDLVVRQCWSALLEHALRRRNPLRLGEAAAIARRIGTPSAQAAAR